MRHFDSPASVGPGLDEHEELGAGWEEGAKVVEIGDKGVKIYFEHSAVPPQLEDFGYSFELVASSPFDERGAIVESILLEVREEFVGACVEGCVCETLVLEA